MSNLYNPTKEQAGNIIRKGAFQSAYATALENGNTPPNAARFAFLDYMGWANGSGLNIQEKNTLNWVASQFVFNGGGEPDPQEFGPDLYGTVIPEYFTAGVTGAIEGAKQYAETIKWIGIIGLTIWGAPKIVNALKGVKTLAKA